VSAEERLEQLGIELPPPPVPLGAYVEASLATTHDFTQHAKVADAASELLVNLFGREKISTRMVYGVSSLPAGVCAVVELILEVGA
jgi:hypothetical protein